MKIHDNRPPAIQPGQTPVTPIPAVAPAGNEQPAAAESRRPRRDSVELSAAARAATSDEPSAASSLSPQRLAEIRQRIHAGAYGSLELVDEVARRILASGDV